MCKIMCMDTIININLDSQHNSVCGYKHVHLCVVACVCVNMEKPYAPFSIPAGRMEGNAVCWDLSQTDTTITYWAPSASL